MRSLPGFLALIERGDDSRCGEHGRRDICDGNSYSAGPTIFRTVETHQPRNGLDGQIVSGEIAHWARLPVTRCRRNYQARILLPEFFRIVAEPRHHARSEILRQNICPLQEGLKDLAVAWFFEV